MKIVYEITLLERILNINENTKISHVCLSPYDYRECYKEAEEKECFKRSERWFSLKDITFYCDDNEEDIAT